MMEQHTTSFDPIDRIHGGDREALSQLFDRYRRRRR